MKLEEAIKQRPFKREESKLGVNILYTASWFSNEVTHTLKPFGISWQQFNLMRILHGQGDKPVSLKVVSDRMIDKQSNTSRLVDKLVEKSLVQRNQCPRDRRQVDICLTTAGKEVVAKARTEVDQMASRLFGHMPREQVKVLNDLLDEIRITESIH